MVHLKKIAVIGASYLQLPLVLKCKELGYKSICFAYLDGAVCKDYCDEFYEISILEKEKILAICEKLKIDAILTIASDVAVPTVNFIAHSLNLTSNPIESSLVCTDKNKMKDNLKKSCLPIANYIQISDKEELFKVQELNYPLIVKPSDRSGSLGVTKITEESKLLEAFEIAHAYSLNKTVIIEEFIIGKEISVESISYKGQHYILAYTDKITSGSPHFVELEHHQPSSISPEMKDEIVFLLSNALNSLGITNGAAHSELIIDENNKLFINEIGARMGGDFIGSHLVELSTGFDYLKAVIDVSLGIFSPKPLKQLAHSGVVYLSKINQERFNSINKSESFIIEHQTQGTISDQLTKSSDRNGYFIYKSQKKI